MCQRKSRLDRGSSGADQNTDVGPPMKRSPSARSCRRMRMHQAVLEWRARICLLPAPLRLCESISNRAGIVQISSRSLPECRKRRMQRTDFADSRKGFGLSSCAKQPERGRVQDAEMAGFVQCLGQRCMRGRATFRALRTAVRGDIQKASV